jgi:cell division transport system permease protein
LSVATVAAQRRRTSDLPSGRDPGNRFLPWIIGVMVYLASLSLAGAMVLSSAISGWTANLAGTVTVQILPSAADGKRAGQALDAKVAKALALLRSTPGIARAEPLSPEKVTALLSPWLGPDLLASGVEGELPLPRLIDVTLADRSTVDIVDLTKRLREVAPEAEVDDHGRWLADLISLVHSIEVLSAVIVVLSSLAAITTVIFATRAGLAVHGDVIAVLHLVGARDSYIARQFERRALSLGLGGGLIGLVLAVVTMVAIGYFVGRVQLFGLPNVALSLLQWAVLAALAPVAAVIAMVTARLTVMRALARMP